jgi:hypothetical protein
MGTLSPRERGILISRLCHAFHVFPREDGKGASTSTSASRTAAAPPNEPSRGTRPKVKSPPPAPKSYNVPLKGTRLTGLTKTCSVLLKKALKDPTREPIPELSVLNGLFISNTFKAKEITRSVSDSSPLSSVQESLLRTYTYGEASEEDPEPVRVLATLVEILRDLPKDLIMNDQGETFVLGKGDISKHPSIVDYVTRFTAYLIRGQWPADLPSKKVFAYG